MQKIIQDKTSRNAKNMLYNIVIASIVTIQQSHHQICDSNYQKVH